MHELNAADSRLTRFTAGIARLTDTAAPVRFGVAISGGPDSMALLWLANSVFPGRVEAATVDHGLRPEAADEAAMVARWCEGEGIPHAILRPATPITGNIQSAARAVRYALLHDWRQKRDIDWLLTAHHADDQAETLLMRLNRGSGVAGLAGVRAKGDALLRPLLGWRKSEMVALAAQHGLPTVQDPSNADPRFDRAALRAHLARVDWLDPLAITRSAAALADAEAALQWTATDLIATHVHAYGDGFRLTDMAILPRELQRRIILGLLADDPPRGETLVHALAQALVGGKASIGRWLLSGGRDWTLEPAPPRRKPV